MSRSFNRAALVAVLSAGLIWGCSGGDMGVADLAISFNPGSIDNQGQSSTVTFTATDELAKPGTGSVNVTSAAGSLAAGQSLTLDSDGKATVMFSCPGGADAGCNGFVKISGDWSHKGASVTASKNIVVKAADAGIDGGSDGGSDGGVKDAGMLLADGGFAFPVALTLQKPSLVVGTGDKTDVTATVTDGLTGAPQAATPVTFGTSLGSFAATAGTSTVMVTTDANGVAKTTLFVAGGSAGTAAVSAQALGTTAGINVPFVSVASIVVQPDPSVKSTLGTQAGGRETTTPVLFKVLDANNQPANGIQVTFTIGSGSPGGASVTPSAASNMLGIVNTTLQSGDVVGAVSVVATVTATVGQPSPITATATIQITGGKPSFRGLVVDCAKKNLGALTKPGSENSVPTRSLTTPCSANLADRFGNVVGLATPVSWFAERGTITPSTSGPNGIAVSPYDTTSNFPPNDTTALTSPAEPTNGTKNPRDMLISIIAVVSGEEEFSDKNSNGKWDPGEWFLDLPEPFVDENDNQQWDPGEAYIDTQRLNCTTGLVEAPNNKWDPPNGCWDNNTQIWATTHVIWSGTLAQPIAFAQPPPWFVPVNTVRLINFTWSDPWFNPMANDGAAMGVTLTGLRGSAVVNAPGLPGDGLGLGIAYEKVEATETAAGSGVFTVNGICDTSKPGPTNPLTRCLARYRFTQFGRGNNAQLQLTGSTPQPLLPDGGVAPPTPATIHITGQNTFFTPASEDNIANFE